jgi:hypothetical protein
MISSAVSSTRPDVTLVTAFGSTLNACDGARITISKPTVAVEPVNEFNRYREIRSHATPETEGCDVTCHVAPTPISASGNTTDDSGNESARFDSPSLVLHSCANRRIDDIIEHGDVFDHRSHLGGAIRRERRDFTAYHDPHGGKVDTPVAGLEHGIRERGIRTEFEAHLAAFGDMRRQVVSELLPRFGACVHQDDRFLGRRSMRVLRTATGNCDGDKKHTNLHEHQPTQVANGRSRRALE